MRSRFALLVLVLVAVSVVAVATVWKFIHRSEQDLAEHKTARTTTGVVIDKKRVQFGSDQTAYQNEEGRTVPLEDWRRKSGEFRVFYSIENFDQLPAANRAALVAAEQERDKRFGPRFRIVDQHTFDFARIGQIVTITYRWVNDSKIEIISFELQAQPSKAQS